MKYHRACPECKRDIVYKSRAWRDVAESRKSKCKSCITKGKNNPNFGKASVLKGKKWSEIRTEEGIKIGLDLCRKGINKGLIHTEETREKIRQKVSGSNNGFYGKKHSEELKQKNRERTFKQLKIKKDSSIEKLFESYLQELDFNYRKQEIFAFWSFDFYLPDYDIYIECDGDYWHCNPDKNYTRITEAQKRNMKNDKAKNTYMDNRDKIFLRFWESDIVGDKDSVIEILKVILN